MLFSAARANFMLHRSGATAAKFARVGFEVHTALSLMDSLKNSLLEGVSDAIQYLRLQHPALYASELVAAVLVRAPRRSAPCAWE